MSWGDAPGEVIKREGYEDLKPTGGYQPQGASAPGSVDFGVHRLISFSGTTNERLTNIYHIPHDFVEGTDIFVHIHHLPTAVSPTGEVTWRVHMRYAQGYQFGNYSGADVVQDITLDLGAISAVQYDHIINEGAALNDTDFGSVLRTDGIIIMTIERLGATDSNNADQIFIEADIHYKSDKSATVNRNDTGSGFEKA